MSDMKIRDEEETSIVKIFSNAVLMATLLVGAYLSTGILYSWADENVADNIIASHDRRSSEYNDECLDCHASILSEQSLNPNIPTAHRAMLPSTPGDDDEDKCVFCHRGVDLIQGPQPADKTTANLRKHVNVKLCVLCHGTLPRNMPVRQFYQTELSTTDGVMLYDLACSACHDDLTNSEVSGESAAEIHEKIAEDEGGMGPLAILSTQEIQAIADALANGNDEEDEEDEDHKD